ncbi:hypothetical protein Cci01nite_11900 [Catellatospora citrea]|uniref:Uncharacterized protein n=1 Tax=Catellatospora citrea TaxID=53366 RepID=A0A8J3K3J9_9ACTN|nr:hypothetical protein Cci01nite_11900 [Catellatospora citrea]
MTVEIVCGYGARMAGLPDLTFGMSSERVRAALAPVTGSRRGGNRDRRVLVAITRDP